MFSPERCCEQFAALETSCLWNKESGRLQNEYQRSINGTITMQDLNDYALYAEVIRNGGFAAAGRALNMPKSTLSRRIAALETRLGVRLIERSTRRFRVTEVGQAFYERCRTIVLDVQQADSIVSEALGEPHGVVRCSCPLGLVEALSPTLSSFLKTYPKANSATGDRRPRGGSDR
jgi:DNA-binding transcriptional LysR family regulator